MIDKPYEIWQLRRIAAAKAWEAYRSDTDPEKVPLAFYNAVDIVIKESYKNVDKMVQETIRQRLESLYS